VRHLVFTVERERYAFALESVKEVIEVPSHYTRIPLAPACAKGVINLRGRVVPVIDLKHLMTGVPLDGSRQVVLLELGRRDLGLLISEVEGIESIERIGLKGLARVGALAITVLEAQQIELSVASAFVTR
jgi:purine-binding chemotaxis protein CheW